MAFSLCILPFFHLSDIAQGQPENMTTALISSRRLFEILVIAIWFLFVICNLRFGAFFFLVLNYEPYT
ncbi:MAG: hypothetical protein U5L07_11100 [Desulfobacterales bacterium]|nr:hypothetical protein [Desulfobacterales bacterium]